MATPHRWQTANLVSAMSSATYFMKCHFFIIVFTLMSWFVQSWWYLIFNSKNAIAFENIWCCFKTWKLFHEWDDFCRMILMYAIDMMSWNRSSSQMPFADDYRKKELAQRPYPATFIDRFSPAQKPQERIGQALSMELDMMGSDAILGLIFFQMSLNGASFLMWVNQVS